MCGRYYIDNEDEIIEMREIIQEVNERYKDTLELASMKTGEIFPTETVPIITADGNRKKVELMTWGFSRWNAPGVIINARAETVLDKPMFRKAIESRRCLVPTNGFFEWRHENGKSTKEKYLLKLSDEPMLYLAGIYNTYINKDGNPYNGFVVLTTEANESVKPIHNRMPIILTQEEKDVWLYDKQISQMFLNNRFNMALKLVPQI